MDELTFSIDINAPKEKVWEALWTDAHYREWSSAFMEGSYAESDWKEGSRISFLTPAGDGMYSTIEKLVPNEYMSFRHIGNIEDRRELPPNQEVEKWTGAKESYSLKEQDGKTTVLVEVDSFGEDEMLKESFPKALDRLKAIAESG